MKNSFAAIALLLLALPAFVSAVPHCEERKEEMSHILQQGSSRLRRRIDSVSKLNFLAEDTRSGFQVEAEWLMAWLTDQAHLIKSYEDCSELSEFVESVRLQWNPVELYSRKISALALDWRTNQLLSQTEDPSALRELHEVRVLLLEVTEADTLSETRLSLRRAAFHARTGLRFFRKNDIIEAE
jgi:hypothetical protein